MYNHIINGVCRICHDSAREIQISLARTASESRGGSVDPNSRRPYTHDPRKVLHPFRYHGLRKLTQPCKSLVSQGFLILCTLSAPFHHPKDPHSVIKNKPADFLITNSARRLHLKHTIFIDSCRNRPSIRSGMYVKNLRPIKNHALHPIITLLFLSIPHTKPNFNTV